MYFDFDDYRPDIQPVGSVVTWREGVVLSTLVHVAVVALLLFSPQLLPKTVRQQVVPVPLTEAERLRQQARFVMLQPHRQSDTPDLDLLPESRGRAAPKPDVTPNPVPPPELPSKAPEAPAPALAAGSPSTAPPAEARVEPKPPEPDPAAPNTPSQLKLPETQSAMVLPGSRNDTGAPKSRTLPNGALGDALRNLQRYVKPQQYEASRGGAQFGNIDFDTKGIDFSAWINRFAGRVRRNWEPLIPNGPMALHQQGHVIITLNIHKNGSITDVRVAAPCGIDGFNRAAFGALTSSNPVEPLPSEYPDEKVLFTITFYYNEQPPE